MPGTSGDGHSGYYTILEIEENIHRKSVGYPVLSGADCDE
jgi:hypothetical protein